MILRIQQKLCVLICLSLLATTGQANEALVDQYGSLPTYRSFTISPNGKHYAFIHRQGEDDRFIIMDAATNKLVGGFNAGDFKARSIAFASDDYVILKASNSQRKSGFWGQWENSGALAYHLKTGKINRLLDGTRELHPAQTGLGIIVAIDPERDLAYMPAFTDNRGSDTSYDLYEVKLKTGYGKLHARCSSSTVDWFVDSKDGQVLARGSGGSGDSDLNSTFHLTISQLKSMTKNQLAKQGVFYATYRKNCYSSLSTSCYPARQPSPKSFL